MNDQKNPLKKTARLAGVLYLLLAVVSPYGLLYVPAQITVAGDPAATANNILAHEFMFRTGVAANLTGQVLFLVLVFVLYKLFKDVDRLYAGIMVGLVIVAVPIAFFADVFKIAAIMILDGAITTTLEAGQSHDLVAILLNVGSSGTQMVQLYWGLWLIPFGWLVYKCRFIPRIFGILLILNGIGYTALSFTFQISPENLNLVDKIVMPFLFLGEIPILFWLLIKGVKSEAVTAS